MKLEEDINFTIFIILFQGEEEVILIKFNQ